MNSTDRCELLPFLANGSLGEDERVCMLRHVESCKHCEEELKVLQRVGEELTRDSITPLPAKSGRKRFAEKLDYPSMRRIRPGVWAAAASIGAFILIISFRGSEPGPVVFETVTGPSANTSMDYVFTLAVDSELIEAERQQLWRDLNAQSVARVDDGSRYRVVMRVAAKSMAELEVYRQSLQKHPDVLSATVVAVELPVTPRD